MKRTSKTGPDVDWLRVDATTDADIAAQIVSDPDTAPELDDAWFVQAQLVLPDAKCVVSLRVDRDVLDAFKKAGAGHLTRMNRVLRQHAVTEGWISAAAAHAVRGRGRPRKIA